MLLRCCTRNTSTSATACSRVFNPYLGRCRVQSSSQSAVSGYGSRHRWRCYSATANSAEPEFFSLYKDSFSQPKGQYKITSSSKDDIGKAITICGFLGKRKDLSDKLSFVNLLTGDQEVQVVSKADSRDVEGKHPHQILKSIRPYSAVSVTAVIGNKVQRRPKDVDKLGRAGLETPIIELILSDIRCLGQFPEDIIVSEDAQFGPDQRHLQIRFDKSLKRSLQFRNMVLRAIRACLSEFQEIETPILFKSTPEGAREFLVPTRRPGFSYALPQSPQQYKQILMASGIDRYFQIARCFRDEDLRADRQPEFTQVDLEMAFTNGEGVMQRIEKFIADLYLVLHDTTGLSVSGPNLPLQRITYDNAMERHGTDKPDLRIKDLICRIDRIMPRALIGMLTSLTDPIIETFKFRLNGDADDVRGFVKKFMDSPDAAVFQDNPNGAPGVFIYDPRKPLEGLQAFGFEGVEALKDIYKHSDEPAAEQNFPFEEGDLFIVQPRERVPLSGGSTSLGRLRSTMYRHAISEGLLEADLSHKYLWVTDFPLFSPNNTTDPGQGGDAGFSATHHPFTAPRSAKDVDLLLSNPLKAKADHYDLVVNGIELGGGSRRIHNSEMQQFVMRDILQMSEARLKDFSHLFEVLRAGCPPHAGIALGLDRLIAIMLGKESVRDVIAFPKSGKGEDLLVMSPSLMTEDQQATYHLRVTE